MQSQAAGERVLESITQFLEGRLRLKVNREKSKVDRPWKRKFLGYSLTAHPEPKLKVAKESASRLEAGVRELFRRARGKNLERLIRQELTPKLRGWGTCFAFSEVKGVFRRVGRMDSPQVTVCPLAAVEETTLPIQASAETWTPARPSQS